MTDRAVHAWTSLPGRVVPYKAKTRTRNRACLIWPRLALPCLNKTRPDSRACHASRAHAMRPCHDCRASVPNPGVLPVPGQPRPATPVTRRALLRHAWTSLAVPRLPCPSYDSGPERSGPERAKPALPDHAGYCVTHQAQGAKTSLPRRARTRVANKRNLACHETPGDVTPNRTMPSRACLDTPCRALPYHEPTCPAWPAIPGRTAP